MSNSIMKSASVFSAGRRLLIFSLLLSLPLSAAESLEPNIAPLEQELVSWLADQETEMINLLERLTNMNSGSLNKAGMAELAELFSLELSAMGFDIDTLPGGLIDMPSSPGSDNRIDLADHVLAAKSGSGKRLLLMGHLTPFSLPTVRSRAIAEKVTVFGPGVSDMKGGRW